MFDSERVRSAAQTQSNWKKNQPTNLLTWGPIWLSLNTIELRIFGKKDEWEMRKSKMISPTQMSTSFNLSLFLFLALPQMGFECPHHFLNDTMDPSETWSLHQFD